MADEAPASSRRTQDRATRGRPRRRRVLHRYADASLTDMAHPLTVPCDLEPAAPGVTVEESGAGIPARRPSAGARRDRIMTANKSLRDPPGRARRRVGPRAELEEPILAELFSVERLEQHAQHPGRRPDGHRQPPTGDAPSSRGSPRTVGSCSSRTASWPGRSRTNARSHRPPSGWSTTSRSSTSSSARSATTCRRDYYRELPKLADGHLDGYPRVLGLAWAYIAHTDSRFDPESLRRMVRAYQEVEPLTIGELWAIAISLRILLVENLRRLAEQIVRSRAARQPADELADRLLGLGGESAGGRRRDRCADCRARRSPTAARVAALPAPARPGPGGHARRCGWLEERLAAAGHDRRGDGPPRAPAPGDDERDRPQRDHEHAPHLVVRLGRVRRERQPRRRGPARAAARSRTMDFATRDRYRHAIEELARGSALTEVEVAREGSGDGRRRDGSRRRATRRGRAARDRDPGLLPDRRRPRRRSSARSAFASPLCDRLRRAYVRVPGDAATSGRSRSSPRSSSPCRSCCRGARRRGCGRSSSRSSRSVPASDLAVALVNRAVTSVLGPEPLPRLDLDDGVPTELRTLVVVPMLLTSDGGRRGAGRRPGGPLPRQPRGRPPVRAAVGLARRRRPSTSPATTSCSRPRRPASTGSTSATARRPAAAPGSCSSTGGGRWNEAEGCWMGWERKRGKLQELNALLRGSTTTSILTTGRPRRPPPTDVRYVVTLDADTRLPRGAVGRLVGTIAHPLNQPTLRSADRPGDPGLRRPAAADHADASRPSTTASIFQRIFSGSAGIDPYASAVSDVYQDLFRRGQLHRQGDLRRRRVRGGDGRPGAREHAAEPRPVRGRLRPGRPGDRHRAVRRVPVELPRRRPPASTAGRAATGSSCPGSSAGRATRRASASRSSIPGIARWKMVDNLRRTLSAPLTLATLVAAWTLPSVSAGLWTAFVLASLVVPAALPVAGRAAARGGRASRSAATSGPSARTSRSPRRRSGSASPSSPTRRG